MLYRVHDVPAAEKVAALREFLAELGLTLPRRRDPAARGLRPAARAHPQARPDFALLQTILLRSLKQAVYSPDNVGHFGLAFEAYVHFTSPIRRYPDLLVHRAIKAVLAGKRYAGVDWDALGRALLGDRAARRRREPRRRELAQVLLHARPRRRDASCGTHHRRHAPSACSSRSTSYFVDGLVHISELGRDYFQFDAARHALFGERTGKRYRLADRMTVSWCASTSTAQDRLRAGMTARAPGKVGAQGPPRAATRRRLAGIRSRGASGVSLARFELLERAA